MKAHVRQQFRSAPHVSGTAQLKPRDYEPDDDNPLFIESSTPYAAFFAMKNTPTPLEPGDVLEAEAKLCIFKYVGFEDAQWVLPEPKAGEANMAGAGVDGVPPGEVLALNAPS